MKTEAMSYASFLELAKEYYMLSDLLDSNMEILHSRIYFLEIVEFMVVGGKKSLGSVAIFMDKFNDRACNGHAVICRCSSTDLIKKHKGARRKIMEDHRGLQHLYHEG